MAEQSGEQAQVVKRAMFAYQHDAEFHAHVYRAAAVVNADQRERTNLPLSDGQRNAVLMGAMVALHLRNNADLYGSSAQGGDGA